MSEATEFDPLLLFPGLGADARMFAPLRSAIPQLVTPNWIEPERRESLVSYARRLADTIDPGRPCFIGGASFGGVIALEMSVALQARACFLIGSMRSPHGLPWRLKGLRPLASLTGLLRLTAWYLPSLASATFGPQARDVAQQLVDADAHFMRWAAGAILKWKPSPEVDDIRVFQIHGGRDRVLPARLAQPDRVISNAGHVLSVTHPAATVEFLLNGMQSVREAERSREERLTEGAMPQLFDPK